MYRDPAHLNEFTDFLVRQATKFLDDYWDQHNATRRVSAIYPRKQLRPQENPGLRRHCRALQRFLNSLERGCDPETAEYIEKGLKQGQFQFGYHSTANEIYPIIMDSGFDPFRRKSQTHGRGEYMGVYPYDSHWYSRSSGRMMIVLFRTERMRVANAQAAYVIDNPVSHDVSDCLPILLLEHCSQAKSGQVQLRKYGNTPEPLHVTVGSWHITWKGLHVVATTITTTSNSEAATSGKEETKSIVVDPERTGSETTSISLFSISSSSSSTTSSSSDDDDDASDTDSSSSPRVGPEHLRTLSVSSPGSCATTVVSPEPSESESVPISLGSSLSPTSSASTPQASQWYLRSPLASPSGFSSPVATSDSDAVSQSSSPSAQSSSYPTSSSQTPAAASASQASVAVSRSQSSTARSQLLQTKVGSHIKRILSDLRGMFP